MSVLEIAGYPFEELVRMAKEEPDTFEAVRANAIQAVIESVPVRRRTRLEGLQWRIDMVRQRSNSPLQACSKISNMMWESVVAPGGLHDTIEALRISHSHAEHEPSSAMVIPFAPRKRRRG